MASCNLARQSLISSCCRPRYACYDAEREQVRSTRPLLEQQDAGKSHDEYQEICEQGRESRPDEIDAAVPEPEIG
jgi:hypothetical protein